MSIPNCFRGYTAEELRLVADQIDQEKTKKEERVYTVFRAVLREDTFDFDDNKIILDDYYSESEARALIQDALDTLSNPPVIPKGTVMYRIEDGRAWCSDDIKMWWPYDVEKYYEDIKEVDPNTVPKKVFDALIERLD